MKSLMKDNPPFMYEPWSFKVMGSAIEKFKNGYLPILDIELSARCDHGCCIYCDSDVGSPYPNELSFEELKSVVDSGKKLGVEWVYICGLGEPTDDEKFFRVIEYLAENDIKISMFSCGIDYTIKDIKKLRNCNVNLIIKLDSFDEKIFDYLLGKEDSAKSVYKTLALLLEEGYAKKNDDDLTDLAFSIIPTRKNIKEIPKIVKYCKENNIFPSIGELEFSGRAKKVFSALSPSKEELIELKRNVDMILGYDYKKPICPSAIASLHINNVGKYVVDKETGLSCPWFFLKEPEYFEVGDVREDEIRVVLKRMIEYRKERRSNIESIIKNISQHVFGGCGGDITKLLELYLKATQDTS